MGGEGKVSQSSLSDAKLTRKHAVRAPKIPLDTLEEFYEATKVACDEAKNEVRLVTFESS